MTKHHHVTGQDSAGSLISDNPFLTIKGVVGWFFIAIVLGIIGSILLGEAINLLIGDSLSSGLSNLILLLGIQFSMAVFSWHTLRHAGVNIRHLIGTMPVQYNWVAGIGWAIALMMFTFSSMAIVAYTAVALFPETISEMMLSVFTALAQQNDPVWLEVCMAVLGTVVAPLAEEFTFRGLFFHCWSAHRSAQAGLLLTALLFACLHPQNFVGMFVFSLVLALLYLRTRNLWVPIGVHAIYNGMIFGSNLIAVAMENAQGATGLEDPATAAETAVNEAIAEISQARFGIAAIVGLIIAGFFVGRFLHKNWPQPSTPLPYFQNHSAFEG